MQARRDIHRQPRVRGGLGTIWTSHTLEHGIGSDCGRQVLVGLMIGRLQLLIVFVIQINRCQLFPDRLAGMLSRLVQAGLTGASAFILKPGDALLDGFQSIADD